MMMMFRIVWREARRGKNIYERLSVGSRRREYVIHIFYFESPGQACKRGNKRERSRTMVTARSFVRSFVRLLSYPIFADEHWTIPAHFTCFNDFLRAHASFGSAGDGRTTLFCRCPSAVSLLLRNSTNNKQLETAKQLNFLNF